MYGSDRFMLVDSIGTSQQLNLDRPFLSGGLFLNDQTLPSSFVSFISLKTQRCSVNKNDNLCLVSCSLGGGGRSIQTLSSVKSSRLGGKGGWFLSVSLSREEGYVGESGESWGQNGGKNLEEEEVVVVEEEQEKVKVKKGSGALNTGKHLWAGAVAAMVSRFCLSFSHIYIYIFGLFISVDCGP